MTKDDAILIVVMIVVVAVGSAVAWLSSASGIPSSTITDFITGLFKAGT